ncbi:DNA repair protein xrcc3 [Chamberlinius hualienensis]
MQLSLTAQIPVSEGGLNGAAVYICTEGSFPIKRLNQLISKKRYGQTLNTFSSDFVLVEHAEDVESLISILTKRVPVLIRNFKVKLIIIDSVAALFRCEFTGYQAIERARQLFKLGDILHRLNVKFDVVIITINQLSGVVNDEGKVESNVPSLGLPWSNMVTTRLQLHRTHDVVQMSCDDQGYSYDVIKRKLQVLLSPNLPRKSCYFVVDQVGVKGI